MTTMMVISYIVTWMEIIYSWLITPKKEKHPDS